MTREETLAIMSVLKAAYPNFYKDMKRSEADGIVNLWAAMFADEPADLVAVAIKSYIATDVKGFPPNIGAIKNAIVKLKQPEEMTEFEAWALVGRAIKNGIHGAREEFDKLPEIIQRLVGSPNQLREWAMMDSDTVNSVISSNFQRSYKVRAKTERERLALPGDVRQAVEQIASGMSMPALTERNDSNDL
jgi:hypothetical protein